MSEFHLSRTGDRPLAFEGQVLAEASSHARDDTRWHEVSIYQTSGGKIVTCVSYRTRWQGELGHDEAAILASPDEATAWLRSYDPCAHLRGYPTGEAYDQKRKRLEQDIRDRYAHAVSEVLEALGPERVE